MQGKSLIVGAGEIGQSLARVLEPYYFICVTGRHSELHPNSTPHLPFEILHIAFPYSDEFVSEVKRY
ncbi:MAG: hypothetical protein AABY22_34005, partial [Nanoarchaeota archaeon]